MAIAETDLVLNTRTRQAEMIAQKRLVVAPCRNCEGAHSIQACPELMQAAAIPPRGSVLPAPPPKPVPTFRKEICWDRETRDYAMSLDGELVGFARTYHEAETTLDALVFELMSGAYFRAFA